MMRIFKKGCGLIIGIFFCLILAETFAIAGNPSSEKGSNGLDDIISKGNSLRFYGFIRLDMIYDDSRTDNTQIPFYVLSEDIPAGGREDKEVYTMHPRLSRLGIDFTGGETTYLFNGKISGKFEIDFQNRVPGVSDPNSGVESRALPRIRHMFLKLKRGDFSLLGGQTWDIISPLLPSVNNDTLMWNAGNLGDRRAQMRVGYEPKMGDSELSFIGGIALTGAVDRKDLDGNGVRDGEDSGRPQIQGRMGYAFEMPWAAGVAGKKTNVGIWGAYLWEDANAAGEYQGRTAGVDFTFPIVKEWSARGEAWWGENLSDLRGGIGQGVNKTTKEEIESRGGWIELLHSLPVNSIAVGMTVDNPTDGDLPGSSTIGADGTSADGRTKNQAYYIAERFKPGGGIEIGIDYLYWQTFYKTLREGTDNRVNLVFQYNF